MILIIAILEIEVYRFQQNQQQDSDYVFQSPQETGFLNKGNKHPLK